MSIKLRFKKLSDVATIPMRGSDAAAGYDLSSAKNVIIPARGKALCPTDLAVDFPIIPGGIFELYGRIAPRSGLAWKHSIDTLAGVIDADYKSNIGVILFNNSDTDFEVKVGDRIAQFIVTVIITPEVEELHGDLPVTKRGAGGFGSTGVSTPLTTATAVATTSSDGNESSPQKRPRVDDK